MKIHTKITALVSTILLSAALATPAQAAELPNRKVSVELLSLTVPVVTAPADADIRFGGIPLAGTSSRAPVEAPVVEVAVQTSQPVAVAPAPAVAAPAPATAPTPAQTLPAAPAAPGGVGGAGLLASAYSQLGVQQDCTRMVENALASIGRPVGDLGPSQFLSVGTIVSGPAQPGDILVYGGHVAIAVNSTTAIHGGWMGGTTGVGPIEVGQGTPTIVRV